MMTSSQRGHRPHSSVVTYPCITPDPAILARWEAGLRLYGDAFAAYLRLRDPAAFTPDALTSFEDAFVGSCRDRKELIESHLISMGWKNALDTFRLSEGITPDVLDWNHEGLVARLSDIFDVIEEGGMIHVFSR